MPATRPKAMPSRMALDEQSFQNLLAAAFTIQEHNDQVERSHLEASPSLPLETLDAPAPRIGSSRPSSLPVCGICGALKPSTESSCPHCSEALRPGERLQRNWASMWMKSQQMSQETPALDRGPRLKSSEASSSDQPADSSFGALESGNPKLSPFPTSIKPTNGNGRTSLDSGVPQSASNALLNRRPAKITETYDEKISEQRSESAEAARGQVAQSDTDQSHFNQRHQDSGAPEAPASHHVFGHDEETDFRESAPPAILAHPTSAEEANDAIALSESTPDDLAREESKFAQQVATLQTNSNILDRRSPSPSAPPTLWRRLTDARIKLSFHRADLYLTLAVIVAFVALLWPVANSPHQATLSFWQRTLITLGIAEAAPPPATAHFQGDPSIQVWVDPHTGNYYCPGAEQFGKTAGGRYSTQREAQMDSFEAAGRSVCE
jgi:hypothetical protein